MAIETLAVLHWQAADRFECLFHASSRFVYVLMTFDAQRLLIDRETWFVRAMHLVADNTWVGADLVVHIGTLEHARLFFMASETNLCASSPGGHSTPFGHRIMALFALLVQECGMPKRSQEGGRR